MPLNILSRFIPALLTAFIITACGGGGGTTTAPPPATTSLSGTAAVGFAVANGTVNIKCASSTPIASSTTSASGAIQVTLSGQTLPCAIQVTGGTINSVANIVNYHSIATSAGNVNVTPLTDLLIANLAGTATPSSWFASLTTTQLAAISAGQVTTATTNVKTALGLTTQLTGIDPITTAFTPTNDNVMDNTLEALQTAMTNHGTTYANLLTGAGASAHAGFTPPAGFNAALTSAYVPPAGGNTTPSVSFWGPNFGETGSTVSITGTNFGSFIPAPLVKFGATNVAGPYTNVSNTNITFTVPAGLSVGNHAVTISNGDGTGSVSVGSFNVTTSGGGGNGGSVIAYGPNIGATAIGAKGIDLNWSAITGATGYNIYRSTTNNFVASPANLVNASPVTGLWFADTGAPAGLAASTTYYYQMTALNAAGESPVSTQKTISTDASVAIDGSVCLETVLSTLYQSIYYRCYIDLPVPSTCNQATTLSPTLTGFTVTHRAVAACPVLGSGSAPNSMAAPTVTGLSVTSGPVGTVVTINGANLGKFAGGSYTLGGTLIPAMTVQFDTTTAIGANAGGSLLWGNILGTSTTGYLYGSNPVMNLTSVSVRVPTTLTATGNYAVTIGGTSGARMNVGNFNVAAVYAVPTFVAGSTVTAQSGNADGASTVARFGLPNAMATDAAGNVYVSDSFNENIRKITSLGTVSTLAGPGSAQCGQNTSGSPGYCVFGIVDATGSAARFYNIAALTTDSLGNVYAADQNGQTVRKVTPGGVVTTLAGPDSTLCIAGTCPVGYVDGTGNVARFGQITGLATDSANNLYALDSKNGNIRKISLAGVVTTIAGPDEVVCAATTNAICPHGYVNGSGTAARFGYDPNNGPGLYDAYGNALGLTIDATDNLYVSDRTTIRRITPAGVVTTFAGSLVAGNADDTGSLAGFTYLYDITTDSVTGNMYVIDNQGGVDLKFVRKITPAGVVTTVARSTMPSAIPRLASGANGLYITNRSPISVMAFIPKP